jgi:hypothetical protein
MMWPAGKRAWRAKLAKRKHKIAGWEALGLGPSPKEAANVSMEEIRRLAITLAGVGLGHASRTRPPVPRTATKGPGKTSEAPRQHQRGAVR